MLAIDFFHQKNIIHRDLKLDNILVNQIEKGLFDVRVADFGLAIIHSAAEGKLNLKCGTPGYIAPEIFTGHGYNNKCDMFSLGCMFFNLLSGRHLFPGEAVSEIMDYNSRCELDSIYSLLPNLS